MDDITAQQPVLSYVEGWKEGNRAKILDCLHPECVIIESYGPTYRGLAQVGRWVETWLSGEGNQITRWDVTSFYTTGEAFFFEWEFECTYGGNLAGFEGASIARFKNGKIVFMREYAMTAERYEWQG
jgi:hypothetical protein